MAGQPDLGEEALDFTVDLTAFQPGGYVEETAGTADPQLRGYVHMDASF